MSIIGSFYDTYKKDEYTKIDLKSVRYVVFCYYTDL